MNLKYLSLSFCLMLCSTMSNAANTTQSLDEKLADLSNAKSVNLNKDELAILFGKANVRFLLQGRSIREIEERREDQHDTALVLAGIGLGMCIGGLIGSGIVLLRV